MITVGLSNPKDVVALNNKGIALANLGRYEEAIKSYEQVLRLRPDLLDTQANAASVLHELGRYSDAFMIS